MHWVRAGEEEFKLVVLPLHRRGNEDGEGAGVRVLAYDVPENREDGKAWQTTLVDDSMHLTHNFDVVVTPEESEAILVAGKEGVKTFAGTRTSRRRGQNSWLNL